MENVGDETYKIKKGDFVLLEYTGYIKDTNEIIDTTNEEVAKKNKIFRPENRYGPMLVIAGENWVIKGLDESLIGRTVNEEYEIDIPPEKGFGIRDSKKIKIFTIKRLREAGIKGELSPGKLIEYNNSPAIVRAVVSGRVMLDFNPPLAGKNLKYKVKIVDIIKDRNRKIMEIIKYINPEYANFINISYSYKTKILRLKCKDETIKNPQLHIYKNQIIEYIFKYFPKINKIEFIEEVIRK